MRTLIGISVAVVLLTGCSSKRAFTGGTYEDPNQIEMLSDQFNQNDLQLIAKKMVESLSQSRTFKEIQGRPVIVVGKMKNSSSEHIDMKSLADKITVQLIKTERFSFQDKQAREEVAEEYEYQGSGYVKADQAKGPGKQAAADYLLTGEISSIIQEVGSDKIVYYKMTSKLHNLNSGTIDWTDEKELAKKLEKKSVGW